MMNSTRFSLLALCLGGLFCVGGASKASDLVDGVPLEDAEKLEDAAPIKPESTSESLKTIKAKPITSFWGGGGVTTAGDPSWNVGLRHSYVGVELGGVVKDFDFENPELESKSDFGVDVLLFLDIDDQYISLYAGPGFYGLNYNSVTEEFEDTTISGTAGARLSLARNFAVGVGYHTVRGFNGSFVFRF